MANQAPGGSTPCPALTTQTTFVINVVTMATPQKKPVPVYLRGIPTELVREAKAAAAKQGVTLAGFVAQTLARALEKPSQEDRGAFLAESDQEAGGGLRRRDALV